MHVWSSNLAVVVMNTPQDELSMSVTHAGHTVNRTIADQQQQTWQFNKSNVKDFKLARPQSVD